MRPTEDTIKVTMFGREWVFERQKTAAHSYYICERLGLTVTDGGSCWMELKVGPWDSWECPAAVGSTPQAAADALVGEVAAWREALDPKSW